MAIAFSFTSNTNPAITFDVVSFTGYEGISKLYRYEIEVKLAIADAADPQASRADLDDVLASTASFTLDVGGTDQRTVHGMLASFQENQTTSTHLYYTAVLVPQLWKSSIARTNEIFTAPETSPIGVDDIIRSVLTHPEFGGYTEGTHFDMTTSLSGPFIERTYVCQFRESDFHFIARLMENEGIYFYFDQSAVDTEKLMITNTATYPALPTSANVIFDDSAGSTTPRIFNWICRKERLPEEVSVRDFNPAQPSADVFGEALIEASGVGSDYLYGENFSDATEAGNLAAIRAEMYLSGKTKFYSETTLPHVEPGYTFNLNNHLNTDYNGVDYLITEVTHEGSGLDDTGGGTAQYQNSVVAIRADIQFRPQLLTPKPRFQGTMTAFVYAEASGDMAEVDAYGRYRVHLPFDRAEGGMVSTDVDRKASAWIRMAGPYTGESEGLYFPLRGGTEVLLTFINGDPDRPIISGAVPNAANPALLNADRPTESIIQTPGGNTIRMEDDPNKVRVIIESPTADSSVRIGAPDDADELANTSSSEGIRLRTEKNLWLEAQENYGEYVMGKPADAPTATQALLDQFGSSYAPTGLIPHTSTSNTGTTVDTAIVDAHVRVAKCDTFNTQEGNIYDFGGYWNYNLGNSYTENYMDQGSSVALNQLGGKDSAAAGGPMPGTITAEHIANLDNNTWIEKTFGGTSYEYTKDKHSLSIEEDTEEENQAHSKKTYDVNYECESFEYSYGCKSQEHKFVERPAGSGTWGKFYQRIGKAEHTWCKQSGNLLAFSISTQDVANCTDSMSFDWANTATASFTFASAASLSIEASAKFSLSGSLTASTSIDFSAGISMDIKVPWSCMEIDITRGGDTKMTLPGFSVVIKGPDADVQVDPPNKTKILSCGSKTELKSLIADVKTNTGGLNMSAHMLNMYL